MKLKNTLTGDRKIMNMQKLGIVVQSKMLSTVAPKTLITRMNRASRAIHYAYFKGAASRHGSRHGFAFDVTNLLRALPSGCNFSAPGKISLARLLVTLSHSFSNREFLFSLPTLRKPLRVATSSGLKSAKQLFHPFQWVCGLFFTLQTHINGFDVGTSPHGLSVNLRPAVRKVAGRSACALSAKPVLSFGGAL
jgi:hypothetical protein